MDVPAIMAQTRVKITKTIESFENKAYKVVSGLIADKGYAELSMKMIAKEMDVAVETLYNYYKNKEDLTTSVIYISGMSTLLSTVFIRSDACIPLVSCNLMSHVF